MQSQQERESIDDIIQLLQQQNNYKETLMKQQKLAPIKTKSSKNKNCILHSFIT